MLKQIRYIRSSLDIPPKNIWNFDEIRIYASPQDLNSCTLEFASCKDPMVRKVANPKEAYTGIVMVNGDGLEMMVFLVTKKALPEDCNVHTITIKERTWEENKVKVTPVDVRFAVIHGVTVIKVPPGRKAWCSALITEAFLRIALFRVEEETILQVH